MLVAIELNGMEFFAYHGCLEAEKRKGNTFRVDVEYKYDAANAAMSDILGDAIDYSAVYDIVRREMNIPSNLLENVAFRIKAAIETEVHGALDVKVCVSKRNPPVGGPCEWSKVTTY